MLLLLRLVPTSDVPHVDMSASLENLMCRMCARHTHKEETGEVDSTKLPSLSCV